MTVMLTGVEKDGLNIFALPIFFKQRGGLHKIRPRPDDIENLQFHPDIVQHFKNFANKKADSMSIEPAQPSTSTRLPTSLPQS